MKLEHAGIYRAIGRDKELLINVVGEYPCFRIVKAIDINEFVINLKVIELNEESLEIQSIYHDPESYLFLEWEYSDVSKLPDCRQSKNFKVPKVSDDLMKEFEQRYLTDIKIPGFGIGSTKFYIADRMNWTISQAHMLVMQIAKRYKKNGN